MAKRRANRPPRQARRASAQQIIFAVIGLLVILAFILSLLYN